MDTRTALLTGASDGIGAAAARSLATEGHRLLLVGRSVEKTEQIARETGSEHFIADFARFDDVQALAAWVHTTLGDEPLDVLANNAGGIFGDRTPTVDGFEKTLQVDHLSPFLLTELLLPRLLESNAAVINTSSIGHRVFGHLDVDDLNNDRDFSPHKAYGDAKLANVLHAQELHRRYHAQGLSAVAFHPGNVRTGFAGDSTSPLRYLYTTVLKNVALISPEKGGQNLCWFVEGTPGVTWRSGAYYDQKRLTNKVNPQVDDGELSERLWSASAEMVGLG